MYLVQRYNIIRKVASHGVKKKKKCESFISKSREKLLHFDLCQTEVENDVICLY